MKVKENRSHSSLSKLLCLLCFCLFIISSISAQNKIYFSAKEDDSRTILEKLETATSITINYSDAFLPTGEFNFSIEGSKEEVINTVFNILDRDYSFLDKNVLAMRNSLLVEEKRKSAPILEGNIVDTNREELPFVLIRFSELDLTFESDKDGHFSIEGFYADEEPVELSYLGYKTNHITYKGLGAGPVSMEAQNHILGEVVIEDFMNISSTRNNAEVISTDDIRTAGSADNDVLGLSQLMPGVYSASESLSEMQIRGGPPDQTEFRWNNIKILQNSLFFGKISSINPFMVNEVSVSRNGNSAAESSQASGAIKLSNSNHSITEPSVRLHSNLLYSNIGVSTPLLSDKIQLQVAFRKSYTELFQSKIYQNYFDQSFQSGAIEDYEFYQDYFELSEFFTLNPEVSFKDLSGSLFFNISENTKLGLSYLDFGNSLVYQRSEIGKNKTSSDELRTNNKGYSANLSHQWSRDMTTSINYSRSDFDNEYLYTDIIQNGPTSNNYNLLNEVEHQDFKVQQSFLHENVEIQLGYQYEDWDVNFEKSELREQVLNQFDTSRNSANEHSFFLVTKMRMGDFLQLENSFRKSYYSRIAEGKSIGEPRVHLSYFPTEKITLHAHYGEFHQNLNKSYRWSPLQAEDSYWFLADEIDGNPWLFQVRNTQYSAGARYLNNGWNFNLDLYRKKVNRVYSAAFDFTNEEHPWVFGDLNIKGLELSGQYQNSWSKFLWTYEYVDELLLLDNDDQIPSPYTQPHRVSLYQSFVKNDFTLSLHWKFATGRYFSLVEELSTYFDENGDEKFRIQLNEIFGDRVPNYHNLDLSLIYNFKIMGSANAKIGLHINNVYNKNNILSNEYFVDYRQEVVQLGLFQRQGLPFTPNVSLDIEF